MSELIRTIGDLTSEEHFGFLIAFGIFCLFISKSIGYISGAVNKKCKCEDDD